MPSSALVNSLPVSVDAPPSTRRRVLTLAGLAHALHDGLTDTTYVLLPIWQAEFGLGYGALAMVRGVYAGTMAGLQLPAGRLAERFGVRAVLVVGTLLAALGYALAGLAGGVVGLCLALALSGCGSSTQHPLASGAVSRVYGRQARGPLGVYNFAGDLGKAALPALASLALAHSSWRHALWLGGLLGLLVAAALAFLMPAVPSAAAPAPAHDPSGVELPQGPSTALGFRLLLAIGVLDTGVRMGVLTFLPFILKAEGISAGMLGTALALVFIGGAAGKFLCGALGARLGVVATVLATETATAAAILAVIYLPLVPALCLLPLLGVMLNGTSSVLYGTVPELAPADRTERGFALFYTGIIAAGAIAPIGFGLMGDAVGVNIATIATAGTALAILPLALALGRHLPVQRRA